MDQVISSAGAAADAAAIARDELKYKKGLAERQKLEDSAPEPEHVGLRRDRLRVADPRRARHEHGRGDPGRLQVQRERQAHDHQRPWRAADHDRQEQARLEQLRHRVQDQGEEGHTGLVSRSRLGPAGGGLDVSGYEYDKLALCNSATDADKKPHLFQGIPDDQWVRLKYRCLGGKGDVYDVVVDGKERVPLPYTDRRRYVTSGGFAFLVGKGQVEIEELKAKVVSRKWDAGGGSDDD